MYDRDQLPNDADFVEAKLITELLVTADSFGLKSISIGTLEGLVEWNFDPLTAAIREKRKQSG